MTHSNTTALGFGVDVVFAALPNPSEALKRKQTWSTPIKWTSRMVIWVFPSTAAFVVSFQESLYEFILPEQTQIQEN